MHMGCMYKKVHRGFVIILQRATCMPRHELSSYKGNFSSKEWASGGFDFPVPSLVHMYVEIRYIIFYLFFCFLKILI